MASSSLLVVLNALRLSRVPAQEELVMEILYFLVPLSVVLVYLILIGVWWAIHRGQFDEIDVEGERILRDS